MAHIVGVIISTRDDVADDVQRLIEALRRPLHLSRNKSAAMYLPNGADKGAGLAAVLEYLGIGPDAVVGFGDAENDLAFLRRSGISVAVASVHASVKEQVDVVTDEAAGDGVAAFIHGHARGRSRVHALTPRRPTTAATMRPSGLSA